MLTFLHNLFSKATERQLICIWLAFCFVALTYKLDGVPPYHSDENYYVESTRNMVESGDYLTPIYQDKKRQAQLLSDRLHNLENNHVRFKNESR